ncbi:hypothetical protein GCM10020229_14320 [Kitasatospora albolonga]|uniref:hypothetical protein n=1 Tax=Kitasatospora albolonga TaxID=68173 RepID=UPI0031E724D2
MWNDLVNGAPSAGVVIADTPPTLETSFASIDFFESRGIPFVVAIQLLPRRQHPHPGRDPGPPLDLDPHVPMLVGDIRERPFGRDVLLALVDHLMALPVA